MLHLNVKVKLKCCYLMNNCKTKLWLILVYNETNDILRQSYVSTFQKDFFKKQARLEFIFYLDHINVIKA